MSDINDGGPAFPVSSEAMRSMLALIEDLPAKQQEQMAGPIAEASRGMSLRDYMAIHSTQPGCMEICKCAGIGFDGMRVFLKADDQVGMRFDDWFRSLSLERICELSAMVRYAQADGMLKVRAA
jgi:hypothetical protein